MTSASSTMSPNATGSSSYLAIDALDIFPAEVWERVIQHACLDGGATARALSLVSHSFFNVTRRFRFWSLRIMDVRQLLYAVHMLRREADSLGEIRHLFLGATDFVVGGATTFELDSDNDVDSVTDDPDYDQPDTDEEDDEDFESSSETSDRLESWESVDGETSDEHGADAAQDEHVADELDDELANPDDLDEDIAFFGSPEGRLWDSSYDSSQPPALPLKSLESMRELLESRACQYLESLTLYLTFSPSGDFDVLDYLPRMPTLTRLSIISRSSLPDFDPPSSSTSTKKFPKLRYFRFAGHFLPPPHIDTILQFVNRHTESLVSLRFMPLDRPVSNQITRILQSDAVLNSIEAVVFDVDEDEDCSASLGSTLAQPKLLQKIHFVGLGGDSVHRIPNVRYWIHEWELDIEGTPESWERRYNKNTSLIETVLVRWIIRPLID